MTGLTRPRTGTRGVPRAAREASIRRAATDLFGTQGFGNVSIAAVAERADVSKALVLSYFSTKEQLFISCADDVADRLSEPVAAAVGAAQPGFAMARAAMHAVFVTLADNPHDWHLLHDPTLPHDSAALQRVRTLNEPFQALSIRSIEQLFAASPDPDPRDAVALRHLWDGVVGSCMAWWYAHPDETPDSLSARLDRIVLALFAAPH